MSDSPIVNIADGSLRGVVEKTDNNITFYSFMGIPYAKPPIEDLKFRAPQPPQPWKGILDANKENHQCPQIDTLSNQLIGEFDCLYLNVFTPQLSNKENKNLKAVMVWVHGGAFTSGSKDRVLFSPEFLIDKDVVIITLNYRLGVLGLLSLEDESLGVSGNAGLKDQVMALKWVQKNIAAFGGDPNNITIFGASAGSASVSFLLLSPMCKGLYHKAILQSGVATCSWAEGNTDLGKEMIKALGKNASSEAQILSILENATKEELIEAQQKLPDVWKPCERRYLSPTVETSTSEERFLPDTPLNILKSRNYNKVPIIMGCTSNEGIVIPLLNKSIDARPSKVEEYIPFWLNVPKEKAAHIGKSIKDLYYGSKVENDTNIQSFYDYITDMYFCLPIYFYAKDLLLDASHSVYLYSFDAVTKLNQMKAICKANHLNGACHGDDLFYLFKTLLTPLIDDNSQEFNLMEAMTSWWTNFAKYGNPNCPDSKINWPKATEHMEYLNIGTDCIAKKQYRKIHMDFWKSIGSPY